jgi:hypothetical protein
MVHFPLILTNSSCLVASGYIDCYFESGVHIWDICAGSLILKEAGGGLFNYPKKQELDLLDRRFLAVRPCDDLDRAVDLIVPFLEPVPVEPGNFNI